MKPCSSTQSSKSIATINRSTSDVTETRSAMPVHQEVRQSMEALKRQLWRQIMHMWCCYSWCAQHVSEDDDMWEATNNMLPEDMFFWGKKPKLMLHACKLHRTYIHYFCSSTPFRIKSSGTMPTTIWLSAAVSR